MTNHQSKLEKLIDNSTKIIALIEQLEDCRADQDNSNDSKIEDIVKKGKDLLLGEQQDFWTIDRAFLEKYSSALARKSKDSPLTPGESRLKIRIDKFISSNCFCGLDIKHEQLKWDRWSNTKWFGTTPDEYARFDVRDIAFAIIYSNVLSILGTRVTSLDIGECLANHQIDGECFKIKLIDEFKKLKFKTVMSSPCLEYLLLRFCGNIPDINCEDAYAYLKDNLYREFVGISPLQATKKAFSKYTNPNFYDKIAYKVPDTPEDIMAFAAVLIALEVMLPYMSESDSNGLWMLLENGVYIGNEVVMPHDMIIALYNGTVKVRNQR